METAPLTKKYNYLLPTEEKFRRHKKSNFKPVCTIPYHQSLVYWNGDLGLCCIDYDKKVKMPNIRKHGGFLKTLFSKETINIRKKGLKKKYNICSGCSLGNSDYMGYNIPFKQKDEPGKIFH